MFTKSIRPIITAFTVVLLVIGTRQVVSAHARYVRSEPAADATVTTVPAQVVVYYSQLLDIAKSGITVVDASGTIVSQGSATLLPTDNKAMQVALQPNLAAGRYSVKWQNLSAEDGEEFSESFSFTVGGANQADPPAPATTATPGDTAAVLPASGTNGGRSMLVLIVAGLGLGLAGGALRRSVGKRRGQHNL